MFKILLAEDDRELRQLFQHVLTKNGYTAVGVSNGLEALEALEGGYFDLLISDIMMPKMDGYTLVRTIRDEGMNMPVLMITAKDAFDDMRMGFLSGSDDYMVKPINYEELIWRINALLRRAKIAGENRITLGELVLDSQTYTLTKGNAKMDLPKKEFELLYKLLSYPGVIFTKNQLLDDIWGYDYVGDTRNVDSHVARLRGKLGVWGSNHLKTIYGIGYKIEVN